MLAITIYEVFTYPQGYEYLRLNTIILREKKTKKKTPWPLVCKRTIPIERPPLVDEI
jgi:hypothetical protein